MSTQNKCALPPAGWYCTRTPGHEGPCAAHPSNAINCENCKGLGGWQTSGCGEGCCLEGVECGHCNGTGYRAARVYVGGPMTGYPELNFPAFHARTAELRAEGYEVINPAEVNPDPATPYADCMRKDLAALLTCDKLVLLPGWHASRGASAEWLVADICGLTIEYPASEPTMATCELERLRLQVILQASEAAGFIARVSRRPLLPRAMGNHELDLHVAPRRVMA